MDHPLVPDSILTILLDALRPRRPRRRPRIHLTHLGNVLKDPTLGSVWTVWTIRSFQRKSDVRLKTRRNASHGVTRKNTKTSLGRSANASGMLAQHVLNARRRRPRRRRRGPSSRLPWPRHQCRPKRRRPPHHAAKAVTGVNTSRKDHAWRSRHINVLVVANALASARRNASHPGQKNAWTNAIARPRATERYATKTT